MLQARKNQHSYVSDLHNGVNRDIRKADDANHACSMNDVAAVASEEMKESVDEDEEEEAAALQDDNEDVKSAVKNDDPVDKRDTAEAMFSSKSLQQPIAGSRWPTIKFEIEDEIHSPKRASSKVQEPCHSEETSSPFPTVSEQNCNSQGLVQLKCCL